MRKCIFYIESTDDCGSLDELLEHAQRPSPSGGGPNKSHFEYEVPDVISIADVYNIGLGLAFRNGWCKDDVIHCLSVDGMIVIDPENL